MDKLAVISQVIVGGGLASWVIYAIVIAAIIGIGLVVIRQMGVTVPGWVVQIGWIIVLAIVGIVAIRFLMGVAGGV